MSIIFGGRGHLSIEKELIRLPHLLLSLELTWLKLLTSCLQTRTNRRAGKQPATQNCSRLIEYVDGVENLSPKTVDNRKIADCIYHDDIYSLRMWKMCITYPQKLWISLFTSIIYAHLLRKILSPLILCLCKEKDSKTYLPH